MNIKTTAASMAEITPIIEEILNKGLDVRLVVTGSSMFPMLRNCTDSVCLTKVQADNIKKYAIVLYKRNSGQFVLHRIIKVKNDELFINGDNQNFVEHPIFKGQIVAIVKGFYRKDKYFSCKNFYYRLYSFLWVTGLPIRKYMMHIYLHLSRLKNRFKR